MEGVLDTTLRQNLLGRGPVAPSPLCGRVPLEVGRDGIVAVHGDGGCGGPNIENGACIAGPVHRVVAGFWLGYRSHDRAGGGHGNAPSQGVVTDPPEVLVILRLLVDGAG